jgi:bla regulator protein blaR1
MTSKLLRVAVGCVVATTCVFAQAKPSFEVATIKRSERLEAGGSFGMQPGGRFRSINIDARGLIACAYRTSSESCLFPSQLIGAPDWLAAERYDITAKVSDDLASRSQSELFALTPTLLQSLLEDRFRLRTHRDKRELPVFLLTMANRDGLGPQLHQSTVDCQAEPNKCLLRFAAGHYTGGNVTPTTLATMLSGATERIVVDRTGLQGRYDFELDWSPDQSAPDKPSIFAAVQEQLGLKLESSRAPADVLVIDHVERPSEN